MKKAPTRFFAFLIPAMMLCEGSNRAQEMTNAIPHQTGRSHTAGWTVADPFKAEVFIENHGQFDKPGDRPVKDVKYAVINRGLHVYFTPSGLLYHVPDIEVRPPYNEDPHEVFEEIERSVRKHGKADASLQKYFDDKSGYVNIVWEGASPDASLVVTEQVYDTYSYIEKKDNGESNPIIAHAWKKLTYKNIYPNIDVEYYFPENPGKELGIKYNIIVHPGGDLSRVRMTYSGMQNISLDGNGNIVAEITDGRITDHAPSFSYAGYESRQIQAAFILEDATVSFNVPRYDKTQKLVIDPFTSVWSISPGFTTANDGYTIRIDWYQNVYVMGGGVNMGGFPFARYDYQVKKFSPAGALQWTAVTSSPNAGVYGDMIVLRSGKAFVAHGFGSPGTISVINPNTGAVTTSGSSPGNEPGWRFSYNLATNNNILWIGGGSNNGAHLYMTDTNLTGLTLNNPWTAAGNTEDICYLAQNKAGNFVYTTNSTNSSPNNSTTAPKFCKVNAAAPGTAVWKVDEPTLMMEIGQMAFANGGTKGLARGWATGVNGMVVCDERIFTYDGNNLRAYDPATGNIITSVTVGGAFDKYSGIDVDSCCRVYVGVNGVVKRYNFDLVFDASFPVTGDVYDLRFDPQDDNVLFVTGKGFVQRLERSGNGCPACVDATKTDISGCNLGTGTVTVTDTSATAPFTYIWSNGETTQSISGLTAGTYIVTVTDNTPYCPLQWMDTIVVTGTYVCGPAITVSSGEICRGGCMDITATASGGSPPYAFTWSGGIGGTGAGPHNVCPTTTTTYNVTVTDASGNPNNAGGTVTVNLPPAATPSGTSATCGNADGSACVTASGGTPGYAYLWSNGGTDSCIVNIFAGAYTVTVTDAKSCASASPVTITEAGGNLPVAGFTYTLDPGCESVRVSFFNTSTNSTSWQWMPGDGTVSALRDPAHVYPYGSRDYIVRLIAYSSPACADTITDTINPGDLVVQIGNIPNVFTPNNDGYNDCFALSPGPGLETCGELVIYNRWGIRIYDNRSGICWDGTTDSGVEASEGTYYWIYRLEDKMNLYGWVALVRNMK